MIVNFIFVTTTDMTDSIRSRLRSAAHRSDFSEEEVETPEESVPWSGADLIREVKDTDGKVDSSVQQCDLDVSQRESKPTLPHENSRDAEGECPSRRTSSRHVEIRPDLVGGTTDTDSSEEEDRIEDWRRELLLPRPPSKERETPPIPFMQRYSFTGRSRYAEPGIQEGLLPLHPAIKEQFVEDDIGFWVTFDVPRGHHLHGMFVPVAKESIPPEARPVKISGMVMKNAPTEVATQIKRVVEVTGAEAIAPIGRDTLERQRNDRAEIYRQGTEVAIQGPRSNQQPPPGSDGGQALLKPAGQLSVAERVALRELPPLPQIDQEWSSLPPLLEARPSLPQSRNTSEKEHDRRDVNKLYRPADLIAGYHQTPLAQKTEGKENNSHEPDPRIMELELELLRAKARLRDETDDRQAATGRSMGRPRKTCLKGKTDDERESAYETGAETDCKDSRRVKLDGVVSQTEYETCRDTDVGSETDASIGRSRKRGVRRRPTSRTSSRSDTSTGSDDLASMLKKVVKSTLSKIMEETPIPKGGEPSAIAGSASEGATAPVVTNVIKETGAIPTTAAVPATPLPAPAPPIANPFGKIRSGGPLITLPKFKPGDNLEEFEETFRSLVQSQHWNEDEALAYLLMSVEGSAQMYARGDGSEALTFEAAMERLRNRYGRCESSWSVRNELRDVSRQPGERLENFADRLQEIARRGRLDPADRKDLFYQAFLRATRDTPYLQRRIESSHRLAEKGLKLSDMLRLVREYRDESPISARPKVSVSVCQTQNKKGFLERLTEDNDDTEVSLETRAIQEHMKRWTESEGVIFDKLQWLEQEVTWVKNVIKANKLHHDLQKKMKNGNGSGRPGNGSGNRDHQHRGHNGPRQQGQHPGHAPPSGGGAPVQSGGAQGRPE